MAATNGKPKGANETLSLLSSQMLQRDRLSRLGRWLSSVVPKGASLTITRRRLLGQQDIGEEFAAELRGAGLKAQAVEVESLDDLIETLTLNEKTRKCLGPCGQVKPYSAFSRLKSGPDGKNRYCKDCEKRRVKEWSQKQKGENN